MIIIDTFNFEKKVDNEDNLVLGPGPNLIKRSKISGLGYLRSQLQAWF